MKLTKQEARYRRKIRLRKKINGTAENPRLVVFRSNKYIYAQLIDDEKGNVLAAASSLAFKQESGKLNIENAKRVGGDIGRLALEKNISSAVFDRNGYLYHGRVKALADGAREAGLKF